MHVPTVLNSIQVMVAAPMGLLVVANQLENMVSKTRSKTVCSESKLEAELFMPRFLILIKKYLQVVLVPAGEGILHLKNTFSD